MAAGITGRYRGRLVGAAGVVLAAAAIGSLTSPRTGLLFGIGVGAVWIGSPPFAFAAAHLGLLVLPALASLPELVVLEVGLVLALMAPVAGNGQLGSTTGATGVAFVGVSLVLWLGIAVFGSVAIAAIAMAVAAAAVGYLIDRYARIRLGLVAGDVGGR